MILVMDIIKQHLFPTLRLPIPYSPVPLPFETGLGRNGDGMFFAFILHAEMGRTNVHSIKSKYVGILAISGSYFASLSGRTHFQKTDPKRKSDHSVA